MSEKCAPRLSTGELYYMDNRKKSDQKSEILHQAISLDQLQQIKEVADSIRYGSITLVFQDGALVQIDKSEKIRISPK